MGSVRWGQERGQGGPWKAEEAQAEVTQQLAPHKWAAVPFPGPRCGACSVRAGGVCTRAPGPAQGPQGTGSGPCWALLSPAAPWLPSQVPEPYKVPSHNIPSDFASLVFLLLYKRPQILLVGPR